VGGPALTARRHAGTATLDSSRLWENARIPSRRWSGWVVLGTSIVIAAVLVLAAVLVGTVGSPSEGEGLSFELRKHLIQFFLVTALGAVVAVLVYEYRTRREASERQRQYAIDSIASVVELLDAIYRRVKRTRRLLRVSQSPGLRKHEYVDAMLKLDDDQQNLEQLARELAVLQKRLPRLGPTRASDLGRARDGVKSMERYLGKLWSEYENVARMSEEDFEEARLERLTAFLVRVRSGQSDFHLFNGRYHKAREMLIGLLADSRIGSQPGGRPGP
jgi:membrane protein implicated in regulation of membrane protease activity